MKAAFSVLGLSILVGGCGNAGTPDAKSANTAPAKAEPEQPKASDEHYSLRRWQMRLALNTAPAARFRCTVSIGTNEKVVEWDPDAKTTLSREVYFPKLSEKPPPPSVTCGSEVLMIDQATSGEGEAARSSKGVPFQYQRDSDAKSVEPICGPKPATYQLQSLSSNVDARPKLSVTCSVTEVKLTLSDLLGSEAPIARTRSLDPLTPLVADLAAVAASVAIERAESAGAKLISRNLEKRFCTELTEKRLQHSLVGSFLGLSDRDTPLFPRTCETVRTTSADTLAAVPRMLARALTSDLAELLIRSIESKASGISSDVREIMLPPIRSTIIALLEGRAILTERDAQLLLLQAGQIGLCPTKQQQTETDDTCLVRRAMEAGLMVVAECIREGHCSADDLQRRLLEEGRVDPGVALALKKWRKLVPILARSVDVFQPPPGTTPKATAKVALNTAFDFLELLAEAQSKETLMQAHKLAGSKKEQLQQALDGACGANASAVDAELCALGAYKTSAQINPDVLAEISDGASKTSRAYEYFATFLKLLRELVNGVSDDEPERAVQAAGAALAQMIGDELAAKNCEEGDQRCKIGGQLSAQKIRRTFATLNAILAYASSYRPTEHGQPGDEAQLKKLQLEERKKAMHELIDAATNRVDRGGELVVSVGSAVGGSYGWYHADRNSNASTLNGPGLSLPAGFALEFLPSPANAWFVSPFGFHAQLTVVDLSQYAAAPEGDGVEPEPATAIMLGGQAGILIGAPDLNVLIGAGAGYAPRARFSDDEDEGMVRWEIFAGVYVPFIDLN